MNIGITGAHGFIGSHVYGELINRRQHLSIDICEKFDRTKYSLLDVESVKQFVGDKDVILHIAGVNRADNSDLIAINTLGTLNLLEAIRKYSVRKETRFIFASSLQVHGFKSTPKHLKEYSTLQPTNMYGLSKMFAENIICRYNQDYGIKGVILRMPNVYGSRCKPFYNSVISTFIYLALKGNAITIQGTGNSSRDFIYVKDVVHAFLKSIAHRSKGLDTFNICTGLSTSVRELVEELKMLIGRNIEVNYEEGKVDDFLIGDPTKAKKILNFESKTSLDEGLKETIKWLRESVK